AAKAGISYDLNTLSKRLGVPVVPVNARKGDGIELLKAELLKQHAPAATPVFPVWKEVEQPVQELRHQLGVDNDYEAYLFLEQPESLKFLPEDKRNQVAGIREKHQFFPGKFQGAETIQRYSYIQTLLTAITLKASDPAWKKNTTLIDRIVTHKVWGYVIFFGVLFLIFQAIFPWATVPMDFIDASFASLSSYLGRTLPEGPLASLIAEGIVPGIGGIVIFVPQIAILFAFISILEESGYMA